MVADMQGAVQPEFFETYSLPQLQAFTPYQLEHSGRLVQPVVLEKGAQHFKPIAWGDAMERIAIKLLRTQPDETFWYLSGRSSNEAGFLLQLFARIYGTNHVNNCSYYCHQASGVGLGSVLGTGAGTVKLDDMEKADTVFLIGGNPASNHPRMMRSLMMVRRRGGKVIVVNPIVETGMVNFSVPSDPWSLFFGSQIASTYVQPHIGGDLALVYGLLKRIRELSATNPEAIDEAFLTSHTHGQFRYNDFATATMSLMPPCRLAATSSPATGANGLIQVGIRCSTGGRERAVRLDRLGRSGHRGPH